jgi:hypothetical protein
MKLSENVVWRLANVDQALLLNLENERYFELNATGTFLWKQIDAAKAIDSDRLVSALMDEFDVTREVARVDVDAFLTKMIAYQNVSS